MNLPRSVGTLALLTGLLCAPVTLTTAQPSVPSSGIDLSAIDPSVRPQDDFFRHVNGLWLRSTPIPADRPSISAAAELHEKTQVQLRALIDAAVKDPGTPQARQIGDLYASFMDEAAVEKTGLRPLTTELAAIDAVTQPRQLGTLSATLLRLGASMPLVYYVGQDARQATRYVPYLTQGGLGLPDRDYYLKLDDARFKLAREQYSVYLATLLRLSGEADAQHAQALAQDVLALETELARAQWSGVENRQPVKNYNRLDPAALAQLAPGFDWAGWLAETGFTGPKGEALIVRQPSYVETLGVLSTSTPLATWKAYARTRLLHAYAPYLGQAFVDARFAFVGTALSGTSKNRTRWQRGVVLVQDALGEALGQLYVGRHFAPENKARVERLVAALLATYKESIETLAWMSPATKKEAQAKLATFSPKIAYPKRWIDYSALNVKRDDLLGNVKRARAFEAARDVAKLGGPVDRDEWHMTPQTVNAYYNATMNEIVFPAAVLQPPYFDASADDAVNFGAIGAVIGHEISHGFDDKGSQYDGQGNLRDWWTPEDRRRFAAKTRALVAQYSAFVPVPGYTLNGELTLGENIADNSGLVIAFKAYHASLGGGEAPVIDGLSGDARFFFGFAQLRRGKARIESVLRQIKSDPHSPNEFRVNGVLRNHPGFYATFDLKPGDKLYLPPQERVSIW
ncbi:MAG: M13 family metallopeptidase [Burkholderiales bacterium]